jgi:tetratricopeptide (TPR) repeat protein
MQTRTLCLCCLVVASLPALAEARPRRSDVEVALRAVDELEAQSAYEAARRQLQGLVRHVPPGLGEDLVMRRCELWHRQNQPAECRRCYLSLVGHGLTSVEHIAQARYRAAAAALDVGETEAGRRELTLLVDDLPYTESARRAFVLARALHRERTGYMGETEFLMQVASRLAWVAEPGANREESALARELLAEALVEVGRLRLQEGKDAEAAQRILERAQPIARATVWEDDAVMWLARSLRALGRRGEALAAYQELVDSQKTSWFLGVYASELYDDALYEVGQTLEEMRRYPEAERAYAELFRRVPTSRLLDDAAFRIASLTAERRRDRSPLSTFIRDYPASRHVRAARSAMTMMP